MYTAKELATVLRSHGLPIGIVTSVHKGEKGIEDTWNKIKEVNDIKSKCFESHSFFNFFFARGGLHCYPRDIL